MRLNLLGQVVQFRSHLVNFSQLTLKRSFVVPFDFQRQLVFAKVLHMIHFMGDRLTLGSVVNVRGTTRLTSAAIGEVLNRVCDVVIWLMSAKAI